MFTSRSAILLSLLLALGACKESDVSDAKKAAAEYKAKLKKGEVKKVSTPVPYGKKILCENFLDAAKLGEALGQEVVVKEKGQSWADASTSCPVHLAGEPPKDKKQEAAFKENNRVLGVLPGDELCTVSAYCSVVTQPEDFKKRCLASQDEGDDIGGLFSCVHRSQRADEWAYTIKTVDPDTKCVFEVMGGPSVVDKATVLNCLQAALDSTGPENLKKFE